MALVIGNSKYEYIAELTNPANDARLVAETLRRLGLVLVPNDALLDPNTPILISQSSDLVLCCLAVFCIPQNRCVQTFRQPIVDGCEETTRFDG
jgi:hypothetical protein